MNLELDIRDVDVMIEFGGDDDIDFESDKQVDNDLGSYQLQGSIYGSENGRQKIYVSLNLENISPRDIDKYAIVDVKQMVTFQDGIVNYEEIYKNEIIAVFARVGCQQILLDYNYDIVPRIIQFNVKLGIKFEGFDIGGGAN